MIAYHGDSISQNFVRYYRTRRRPCSLPLGSFAPARSAGPGGTARIEPGHAVAWNPSLPGGAKAEDTYLVHAGGLERVTMGPDWPAENGDGDIPPRPAVLEVGQ